MSANHLYVVPIFDVIFSSLEDAKWNVKVGLTRNEALRYLQNETIRHYKGDRLHSITPIKVDELGNVSFGRTELVNS